MSITTSFRVRSIVTRSELQTELPNIKRLCPLHCSLHIRTRQNYLYFLNFIPALWLRSWNNRRCRQSILESGRSVTPYKYRLCSWKTKEEIKRRALVTEHRLRPPISARVGFTCVWVLPARVEDIASASLFLTRTDFLFSTHGRFRVSPLPGHCLQLCSAA